MLQSLESTLLGCRLPFGLPTRDVGDPGRGRFPNKVVYREFKCLKSLPVNLQWKLPLHRSCITVFRLPYPFKNTARNLLC